MVLEPLMGEALGLKFNTRIGGCTACGETDPARKNGRCEGAPVLKGSSHNWHEPVTLVQALRNVGGIGDEAAARIEFLERELDRLADLARKAARG
jgi:hypothetical protein